jgi:hypothetical protein
MATRQPRYSKEEFARRGQEVYDQSIRAIAEPQDSGKFVAIDIESGAHEIDADDFLATERLFARYPDAQIWLMRVGQPTARRLSGMACSGRSWSKKRPLILWSAWP